MNKFLTTSLLFLVFFSIATFADYNPLDDPELQRGKYEAAELDMQRREIPTLFVKLEALIMSFTMNDDILIAQQEYTSALSEDLEIKKEGFREEEMQDDDKIRELHEYLDSMLEGEFEEQYNDK